MKSSWALLTINDVCSVTDCQHKTAPTVDVPTEYRMLRTTNIRNGQLRDVNDTNSVTKDTYDKWSVRGYLESGDVILTREAPMGEVALLRDNEKYQYFLGQRMLQLKAYKDVITSEFLYYSLQTRELQYQIMMNEGTGSVVSNIRIPLLKKMKLVVPNLQEQQRITKLLFDIDNKIIVNKEIIDNLERLAQTLFKHWFIDFEFPNEQGQSYKSSGGEMVESELGEIPKGWKAGCIGEICEQVKDKVNLDKMNEKFNYIGLEHMPQGSIALANWESSEKVSGNKGLFKKDDILFGKLRPYFKKVGIASINGVCSTDILIFNSKQSFEKSYLLLNLIQDRFIEYATNTATGTRMPRSGWKQISSYKIVIPDKIALSKFEEIVLPMLTKIQDITHENLYLEHLRDTLLPKLLSGEIKISDEVVVD
ncbi:hypothetical protein COI53_04005 [Bacillus thuringiensis]|uniref:restriction endonuclease subunit S n=1 Tax=Bacillus thuringiensis TaxID=1428 RepID=UPI000BF29405|nr:restriction endonuclease subunit S [Bacillus thuringiensis]PFI32608.1 hypothetical protein COI53_04005 [Bacillus thuringiensis]